MTSYSSNLTQTHFMFKIYLGVDWRNQDSFESGSKYPSLGMILWTDETEIKLYQNDGEREVLRRNRISDDLKQTTSCVKH